MLNPITTETQFGGPVGALAVTLGLPIVITVFGMLLNSHTHHLDLFSIQWLTFHQVYDLIFDWPSWTFYLSWFFGLLGLDLIIPGKHLQGTKLRDGTYLTYKINGLNLLLVLSSIEIARFVYLPVLPELVFVYQHQLQLTLVTIVFSFILSTFVYIMSFVPTVKPNGLGTHHRILATPGNTHNVVYDWFIGRELNPKLGLWDIKFFCELKPGLLLWLVINLSCLYHQYHQGHIYNSMILINVLQAWYILDGVLNEEGVISMMDIVTDGFGYMLAFGDLAWVPWSYTLQARYLTVHPLQLGTANCVFITLLSGVGYIIFHGANTQKLDFKAGKLNHLALIKTNTGSSLLVDGWWRLSQHINYFGDWLIGLSWCLTTGFSTGLTYFYVIYFASLLIHRQIRDNEKCAAKYGEAWAHYKQRVPYKIIPYVY